jgi:hypothetical protein
MSNANVKPEKATGSSSFSTLFASILIPVSILVGILVFMFILGNPATLKMPIPRAIHIRATTWV